MQAFIKKNLVTILILGATVILAGIAVFTALRLYQLRQESVSPAAPTSNPGAQVNTACQTLSFTLTAETPTPTPTPVPQCYEACTTPGSQSNCPTGLTCQTVSGNNICVNPSCASNSNCVCATATPTPTPTPTPTSTPGAPNACNGTCGSDTNCQSGMTCYITSGTTGVCRNPSCTTSTTCLCATATPTPTPIAVATPTPTVTTPAPALPQAGVSTPTWIAIAGGIVLLIGAIILAL